MPNVKGMTNAPYIKNNTKAVSEGERDLVLILLYY